MAGDVDYERVRSSDVAWNRDVMWSILDSQASLRPDHDALVCVDEMGVERRLTYRELRDESAAMAEVLAGIGVTAGDGVAVWMTNLVEWIYLFFGAQRIGAHVVPINTFFKPREVAYCLRMSGAQHLVMLDQFRRTDFVASLTEIAPEWVTSTAGDLRSSTLPDLRNVVILNRSREASSHAHDLGTLMRQAPRPFGPGSTAAADNPTSLAMILFTSGSTGFPKGALLNQCGLVTNSRLQSRRLRLTDQDRWFSAMPFFHVGGCVWGLLFMLTVGGCLVFSEAHNARLALQLIDKERCGINFGVRSMYRDQLDLLDEGGFDLTSLRRAQTFDPAIVAEMKARMGIRSFFVAFGMTECYGGSSLGDPLDAPDLQENGWGRPLEGVELRIVDPGTGEEQSRGKIGEGWLRGLVMSGYHGLPGETAGTIDEEGWFHTQDLVVEDEAGNVKWVGRIKAMLKVGGENVSAEEVEDTLRRAAGVAEACVIGVRDERRGEVPRAYVVPLPGVELDAEHLREWCRAELAYFKVPRECVVVATLPLTGPGKVDRPAVIKGDPDAALVEHIQS